MNEKAVKAIVLWLLISPILGWIGYKCFTNDYMTEVPVKVTTVKVYNGMSPGKYTSLEFIAVFKTEDGYLFDRRISPSFASWLKDGDVVTLELRPMDIKQTGQDNFLYFFLALIVGLVCYMIIIVWGGSAIYEAVKKSK